MIVKMRNGELRKVSDSEAKELIEGGRAVKLPTKAKEKEEPYAPAPRAKALEEPVKNKKISSPPEKKGK